MQGANEVGVALSVGLVHHLPEFPRGAWKPAGPGTRLGSPRHGVAAHKLCLDLKLNPGIPAARPSLFLAF